MDEIKYKKELSKPGTYFLSVIMYWMKSLSVQFAIYVCEF